MPAKLNQAGVFTSGRADFTLPLPATLNAEAHVRVAEHQGRFYWSVDVALHGSSEGCRGWGSLPSLRRNFTNSRGDAVVAGLGSIADRLASDLRRKTFYIPTTTKRAQRLLALVQQAKEKHVAATELNSKRATVKPSEAKRWAEAEELARKNHTAEVAENAEEDDAGETIPQALRRLNSEAEREEKNGRGKSTRPRGGARTTAVAGVTTPDSIGAGSVVKIPLEKLHQHAANPEPPAGEIVATMAWLSEQQQLEPLIVRPVADPIGHYEVLAGKRRCLAAARLGWTELECRVREDLAGDDRAAIAVMAASNAQRHAETPIRQALMLQAMIAAGATHEEAGRVYGLESKSGVVNKLRLLQLPPVWHDRLASAEISEREARQLVPYAGAPAVMQALDAMWKKDQKHGGWLADRWTKGDDLKHGIERLIEDSTRPIEKQHKHNYGWELGGPHSRQFEITPEIEASLDIVELPLGKNGAAVKVATNAKEYDKLNVPLIKAKLKQQEERRGAKGEGRKAKGETKNPPTAAEMKRKRKEQDAQTERHIAAWRHRFLRFAAAERLAPGDWRVGLLCPWLLQQTGRGGYGSAPIDEFLHDALLGMNLANGRGRQWAIEGRGRMGSHLDFAQVIGAIDAGDDPVREVEEVQLLVCRWLLWPATNTADMEGKVKVVATSGEAGERLPPIDDDDVEALARFLGVDLKSAWNNLAHRGAFGAHFIEQFFDLHTKDQLADLVEELKIDDMDCKTKGDLVAAFVNQHMSKDPLKLPKAIAPIAAGGKAKKGGKKR